MKIEIVGSSETGLQRENNEDCIFTGWTDCSAIAIVADGMGGHLDGAQASRYICSYISAWWEDYIKKQQLGSFDICMVELEKIFHLANAKIRESRKGDYLCGTTAVLLFIHGRQWGLISVGDSRCYRLKQGLFTTAVEQISVDDTWENQQQVKETLSLQEIKAHPKYGCLVRAVGAEEILYCHKKTGIIREKSVFGLFSDGAYRYCRKGRLNAAMRSFYRKGTGKEGLFQIREAVYDQQAPDNISAVLIKVSV